MPAANDSISLSKIVSIFRDLSINHYMVNDFIFGDKETFNGRKNIMYPVLYLEPTGGIIRNTKVTGYRTQEFGFNLYLLDRINKGDSNYVDTLSDNLYILDTIIQQIDQHQYYMDTQMQLVGDIRITPGQYVYDDNLNGYNAVINISVPQRYTPCNNPIAPIMGYTVSLSSNTSEYRLIGPQGYQGPFGYQGPSIQGPQGNQGYFGYQGFQGNQGYQGLQGLTGSQGNQGFIGFQGNQGNQGSQGLIGLQGVVGSTGSQGNQGWQGNQGYQGLQGITGSQGNQGNQGNQGYQGYQGFQGWQGISGAVAFLSVNTYDAMISSGTPSTPTIIEVISDENKNYNRSTYLWKSNGNREWIASTPDN